MGLFKAWRARQDGGVAVQFALLALPLAVLAFGVYDINHTISRRQQVQNALDAATLLAARSTAVSNTDLQAVGDPAIKAQLNTMTDATLVSDGFTGNLTNASVVGTASVKIKPVIANLWQTGDINISVSSTVMRSINKVEVVMVLDNTGSMAQSSKLTNLKTAASGLIDTLSTAAARSSDPNAVKIGIVPFSTTVRLSSDATTLANYQAASWMDSGGIAPASKALFGGATVNRFTQFSNMGKTWAGCVESRAMPYDVQDTTPAVGTPDTLITPYFWPDEFDPPVYKANGNINKNYNGDFGDPQNNYLADKVFSQTDFMVPQADITKYKKASLGSNVAGPNENCTLAPISRLSQDWTALKASINSMVAVGETHIPIGLAWGWNLLSPNGPFADGVAYGTPKTTKVIILMTDGENTWGTGQGNDNDSDYDGYGYFWENRLGAVTDTAADRTAAIDGRVTALCNNIKAQKIVIYSVGVMVSQASKDLLSGCATSTSNYYDVTSSGAITTAFSAIAGSINNLRISQ